jgi:hypothetical protein
MTHDDYSHMKKEFRIANFCLATLFVTVLIVCIINCSSQHNICKEDIRISGEVIYAIPAPKGTRNVVLKTETGYIKIYGVPMEQPLVNIPVCKAHGKWYWVMP